MTTILIKKKDTAGAPVAGDLTNAAGGTEIAVNTATKRIYTKDSGGTVVELGTNPSGTTMAGNLLFSPDNTYDIGASGATRARTLYLGTSLITPAITNSGLTTGRVVYTTTGGLETSSANLLYDGNTLTLKSDTTVPTLSVLSNSATPNLRLGSQSNTAVYWNIGRDNLTTGDFIFANQTSEKMRIDSSGNVGIGTTSPAGNLQISGSGDRSLMVTGGTSGTVSVQLGDSAAAGQGGMSYDNSVDALFLKSAGSERMRIDSSGNVGIGTSSPGSKLYTQLSSATAYSSGVTGNGLTIYNSSATTNQYVGITLQGEPTTGNGGLATIMGTTTGSGNMDLTFSTRGSATLAERMRIDSSGNVGIGTSSPNSALVVGTPNTQTVAGKAQFNGTTPTVASGGGIAQIGSTDSVAVDKGGVLTFTANTTTLNGYSMAGVAGKYETAGAGVYGGYLQFLTTSSAGSPTERMRIDSSGKVAIGTTTPNASANTTIKASATGDYQIQLEQSNATDGYGLRCSAANGDLTFNRYQSSAYTERMRLTTGGNLYINTATQSAVGARISVLGSAVVWGCGPTSSNDSFFVYNASSVGVYLGNGSTAWSASSDERIKTAITPFENAIEKVCTLRAGTGRYLTDEESVSRSFLIAQDVQAVLPEAINVQDDEIGTLGLQYTDVIPLLVAAIKEQQALITALTARITALETK